MKKTAILIMLLMMLVIPAFVNAEDTTAPTGSTLDQKKVIMNKLREIKDTVGDDKNMVTLIPKKIKEALKKEIAKSVMGTVTNNDGTVITMTQAGKTYKVTTTDITKCDRFYLGKCSIVDISAKDKIQVWGTFTNTEKTAIDASLIRDVSIMKRYGVFIGEITSITTNGFILKSKERGNQTVSVASNTKYTLRNEQPSKFAELMVGNKVQVRGVWDKATNTVTYVTHVKNFSLPVKEDKKPSVTPTAPPTANSENK